jgi:hypothetical protein
MEITEEQKIHAVESLDFLQRLNCICALMRGNNDGFLVGKRPADTKKDDITVARVDFPKTGGVLTFYLGHKYPMKGFAISETVQKINIIKSTLHYAVSKLAENKFSLLLFFLFFRKSLELVFSTFIETVYKSMFYEMLSENRWCDCVREVRRVFSKIGVSPELTGVVSLMLEFDDAYRYRFQWVMEKLNKENKTIPEIQRLLGILAENEFHPESQNENRLGDKWKKYKKAVHLLRLHRPSMKLIKAFLKEVDIDKIKLSKEDRYHCVFKIGFKWGFEREIMPVSEVWKFWEENYKQEATL